MISQLVSVFVESSTVSAAASASAVVDATASDVVAASWRAVRATRGLALGKASGLAIATLANRTTVVNKGALTMDVS